MAQTPEGQWQMKAVPGGPAETEETEAAAKVEKQKALVAQTGSIVERHVDKALEQIDKNPVWTTGFIGQQLKDVGGSSGWSGLRAGEGQSGEKEPEQRPGRLRT